MSRVNQSFYLVEFKNHISVELYFRELMLYATKQCNIKYSYMSEKTRERQI